MIPPDFREEILRQSPEGRIMLTNLDGCVFVYPLPEWERIEQSFKNKNFLDSRIRNFHRFFISSAVEAVPDKQGRILIPPHLRSYAALDKDVVLAGVGDKFEIWDLARYEERRQVTEENFADDMTALAEGGFELRL